MAETSVVRRYARALFDTAHEAGTVQPVEEDLRAVDQVLQAMPLFLRALRAPTVPSEQKHALLDRVFEGKLQPLSLRFLHLVIKRRREEILPNVHREFRRLADELANRLPVTVASAVPLSEEDRRDLIQALSQRTGKQVSLEVSINPELMGGMVVRMGDTIIDGSVRTRLAQLKSRLLAGWSS